MSKNIPLKNRLPHIDRLKVIGLLLVVLAHVDLPVWLAQIRSFDVPLLVFISSFLARKSYDNNVVSYYKKRFFRLAVPAWIFALIFWVVQSIVLTPPTFLDILKGITFQRDANMLGMLWVVWVYIVCALIIPIINKMKFTLKSQIFVLSLLIIFQVLCSLTTLSDIRILYCTVFTVIPYGFITYIAWYYDDMKQKNKYLLSFVLALIFLSMSLLLWMGYNKIFPITEFKYPAQSYFLLYSIPIIVILFEILPRFNKYNTSRIIQFISKSSLWIYLWHILVLYAVKMFIKNTQYWLLQYVIVITVSITITLVQNKIVDWLIKKFGWKFLSVFKG